MGRETRSCPPFLHERDRPRSGARGKSCHAAPRNLRSPGDGEEEGGSRRRKEKNAAEGRHNGRFFWKIKVRCYEREKERERELLGEWLALKLKLLTENGGTVHLGVARLDSRRLEMGRVI